MSDNAPAKVVTVLPWHYMINLHSIFCKVDANSNKLVVLLEPHSSFLFQYRLLTMKNVFQIAVYTAAAATSLLSGRCAYTFQRALFGLFSK